MSSVYCYNENEKKALATHEGLFTLGSVAWNAKLPWAFLEVYSWKLQSSEHRSVSDYYCLYLFWSEHGVLCLCSVLTASCCTKQTCNLLFCFAENVLWCLLQWAVLLNWITRK